MAAAPTLDYTCKQNLEPTLHLTSQQNVSSSACMNINLGPNMLDIHLFPSIEDVGKYVYKQLYYSYGKNRRLSG